MKNIKRVFIGIASVALIAGVLLHPADVWAQRKTRAPRMMQIVTPEALVRKLYTVHKEGNGPVFTPEGRKYQREFFTPSLQKRILKSFTGLKPGEEGNLDFDPLYNAQDFGITVLHIGPAQKQKDKARLIVPVTFKNFGHPNRICYRMRRLDAGWRIEDIDYGSGQTLARRLAYPL